MNELALFAGAGGGVLGGGCSDGEQFAQLNVMPTPHKFWRNDKTMEFSSLSRFGLTLRLLTESHGEELLMSFLAGFPVRTLAQPEKAQALKGRAVDCGKNLTGLLAKWSPVSSTWKTAQCSLFEDLELSLETWPRAGSMRNGACYQQPMLAHPILEKESGYWLTPRATESGENPDTFVKRMGDRSDRCAGSLSAQVKNPKTWPTPRAKESGDYQNVNRDRNGISRGIALTLSGAVKMWPTPCASEARQGLQIRRPGKKGSQQSLSTAVTTWATPVARDYRSPGKSRLERTGSKSGDSLPQQVGGQLNPTWVEWLMGWTLGWTSLKPLAMDKFLSWQQQHSLCLHGEQELSEEAA